MSRTVVEKTLSSREITQNQLDKISKYTRRKMDKTELFVFSVLLCDNEIDRDLERFSDESLERLAELYLGKTGIFDHSAVAKNQSARIFETQILENGIKNTLGQPYKALKASAYMVRSDKTQDLILEIDAGIKKEVSVGCAVAEVVCSVCGTNQKTGDCEHKKGKSYNGVVCHHILKNPTDAYEWSFVAVPAQRHAGVIKGYGKGANLVLNKLSQPLEEITLKGKELEGLKSYLEGFSQLCKAGEKYRESLEKETLKNAAFTQPQLDSQVFEEILSQITLEQLESLHKGYKQLLQENNPGAVQLARLKKDKQSSQPFRI